MALIDSLWHNYFIPPIIFFVEERADSAGSMNKVYVCMDGKQVNTYASLNFALVWINE
jgi:hypothetical protein